MITGKDLIVYILQNNLENEEVFKDGRFLGFMTEDEAAEKFDVGTATIDAWVAYGVLPHIQVGDSLLIPANAEKPKH